MKTNRLILLGWLLIACVSGAAEPELKVDATVQEEHQVRVVLGVQLDQHRVVAQRELALHNLRYFLQFGDNRVVHRTFLQRDAYVHAQLVAQHFGVHVVARTGDDTYVIHALHSLVYGCATDAALVRYVLERDACVLGDDLQNLAI